MIRRPIQQKTRIALGLLSILAMALCYSWISHRQHQANAKDTTIPSWGQLKEGVAKAIEPNHRSGERWLLVDAKATGDRLGLGLNSDASVARLKGPDRPVQSESSRAAVLAALSTVDLVVIFNEDTPLEMIKHLRPDVLVKGADYTVDTVVGAAEVQSWGGEVILADLVDGFSTTATIDRLNG